MKTEILGRLTLAALLAIGHFGGVQAEGDGGNASDPTASVNYTDIRFQSFDLYGDASDRERDRFAIEGAYIPAEGHKFTYELNYRDTDVSGSDESDFESLKLKYNHLKPGQLSGGTKDKRALGVELIQDLGEVEDGTGSGTDQIAPLFGYGWVLDERSFVVTLVQYFHSYEEESGVEEVRQTAPRLIWIYSLPDIKGWFKLDNKFSIDHEDDNHSSNIIEMQLGKMFTPRIGAYVDVLVNNAGVRQYDDGIGIGLRMTY